MWTVAPNESKKPIILAAVELRGMVVKVNRQFWLMSILTAVELLLKSTRARNGFKFSALFSHIEANYDLGNMNLGQDLTAGLRWGMVVKVNPQFWLMSILIN